MSTSPLFQPLRVGPLTLPNRLVMAPMTRGRAEADGTPNALMATYYGQRATAGLIVTEATAVSPTGHGWVGAPGVWSDRQAAGWRQVTDAVHAAGGRIFLQLWHMGRTSHPDFLGGALPVGPSAIAAKGETHTPQGKKSYVTPRALRTDELAGVVAEYAGGARRARAAGFDGVEIHGANGYLIDQFLRTGSNQRTDAYGGSIENRARLLLEVTKAVATAWSADRVGVRLSPRGAYNDMADADPATTFAYAAEQLGRLGIAYLHAMEPLPGHMMAAPGERVSPAMKKAFGGVFIANGGYDAASGAKLLEAKEADLIAFGVPFLSNPDLVERYRRGAGLNAPDYATLYTPGAKGYSDYPALANR